MDPQKMNCSWPSYYREVSFQLKLRIDQQKINKRSRFQGCQFFKRSGLNTRGCSWAYEFTSTCLFEVKSAYRTLFLLTKGPQSGTTEETRGMVTFSQCPGVGLVAAHHTALHSFAFSHKGRHQCRCTTKVEQETGFKPGFYSLKTTPTCFTTKTTG